MYLQMLISNIQTKLFLVHEIHVQYLIVLLIIISVLQRHAL